MHLFLFLMVILAGAPQGVSWSVVFRRKMAVGIVTFFSASVLIDTTASTACAAVDEPTTNAISNVLRVSYSLKNVDESIQKGCDVKSAVTQIKSLVSVSIPLSPTHYCRSPDIVHLLTIQSDE